MVTKEVSNLSLAPSASIYLLNAIPWLSFHNIMVFICLFFLTLSKIYKHKIPYFVEALIYF